MSKSTPKREKTVRPTVRRATKTTRIRSMRGGTVVDTLHCADFIGRDQVNITYGYSARELEHLIERVLAFLGAGATFLPRGDTLRAELDGETLTFRPGAIQQLALRRNERAYLLSLTVRRDYQIWATKFIPLAAQVDKRIVAGLDMPMAYSEYRIPREGEGPDARITTEPLQDITEALAKHSAFVILGEPGAGKTTTLQKIAFETARTILAGGDMRVPLFVRLSQQANRTPFDFLRAEWEQRTGTDFADALAGGRVLLLADGINELPRDDRDERLKTWRIFASDYCAANQIVFTSRERGEYDRQLGLPRVRVEPLDAARIADYLERNAAVGLGALLADPRSRLSEMARNPFNLSLLAHAYKSNQREMSNRGRLLEWFVGELYAREERLAHRGWIRREAQTLALQTLAFTMQAQGESTTFARQAARDAVPPTVEVNGEEIVLRSSNLFRFARAATILDPATEPDLRFYHHLLQEYFAALELLRRFEAGEDHCARWQCKRLASEMPTAEVGEWDALPEPPATGWEVTTILAAGLARDPARLIEAVRQHNPALAGRCLDEAGIEKPASVTDAVRADLLADLHNPAVHLRARLQAGFTLGKIGDPRFASQTINGVQVIVPAMVRVPAGKYIIGDDASDYADEKPQHPIELPAFEIGKYPVTNAEYACFIQAGGYKDEQYWKTDLAKRWLKGEDVAGGQFASWLRLWQTLRSTSNWQEQLERTGSYSPKDLEYYEWIAGLSEEELKAELDKQLARKSRERPQYWDDAQYNNPVQPVVGITWFEANAYCAWLSEITGREFRLPTEVEWEAAARGFPSPLAGEGAGVRSYPWGDEWDATRANTIEGRVLKPSPVGTYQAAGGTGPFGTEDHAGNVWNWTSTLFKPYPYQNDDRENPESEGERVARGGSWGDDRDFARCASRGGVVSDLFNNSVGFRLFSPGIFLSSGF